MCGSAVVSGDVEKLVRLCSVAAKGVDAALLTVWGHLVQRWIVVMLMRTVRVGAGCLGSIGAGDPVDDSTLWLVQYRQR